MGDTPVNDLDDEHVDGLRQAIVNVLQTDLALTTFAQIIDGLPLSDTVWDQYNSRYHRDHPINRHSTVCPGSIEKATRFRDDFDTKDLRFKNEVLQQYQNAPRSTRSYNLRLLELTVSALHQIAVFLFNVEEKTHDPSSTANLDIQSVTSWERPPDMWARFAPPRTLFHHPHFMAHQQYPNGIADIVGYWAENRIMGGVCLFDRSQRWGDGEEPNVYFESSRHRVTFRICQLLDDQQDSLFSFLQQESTGTSQRSPLPIIIGSANRVRVDPIDAISVHKIYRDIWEREPPKEPTLRMQRHIGSRQGSSLDYPELDVDAEIERLNRM